MKRRYYFAIPVLAAGFLAVSAANDSLAGSSVWVGSSGGNWSASSNWYPRGLPGGSDIVYFYGKSGSFTVAVDASPTIKALFLDSSAYWTLSGPAATLTISTALVFTGATVLTNQVVEPVIAGGCGITADNAWVRLHNANTYTGGTTVSRAGIVEGQAQTSGTPFGSATAGITLGGTLTLAGTNSATTTEVGNINVEGYGKIKVAPGSSGNTVLNAASLMSSLAIETNPSPRSTHEVLYIDPAVNGGTARFTVTGASPANPLPGYFIATANTGGAGDFAKYTTTGFTALSGSEYTVPTNNWTNIVQDGSQVVDRSDANLTSGNQTLAAALNPKIYGLKHGTSSPNYTSLNLNGNLLTVGRGGIFFTQLYDGWDKNQIQGSVTFADAAGNPVEGFIYVGSDNKGGQMGCFTITSIITAGAGLTFSGPGTFYRGTGNSMTPGTLHNVTGPVTIHQARLVLGSKLGTGPTIIHTNSYVLDQGGTIICDDYGNAAIFELATNSSVTIGPGGGSISGGPYGNGSTMNLKGSILNPSSGPTGPLTLKGGGNTYFTLSNSNNNYSGGTYILSSIGSIQVTAVGALGTGPVDVGSGKTLALNAAPDSDWQLKGISGYGTVQVETGSNTTCTLTVAGGTVSPGDDNNAGTLTVSGKLKLDSAGGTNSTLLINLNGIDDYDQLVMNGDLLSLSGASLSLRLGNYSPAVTDEFCIVRNSSSSAITGAFKDLSENRQVAFANSPYVARISYLRNVDGGAVGNDVMLYHFAPAVPGTVIMVR